MMANLRVVSRVNNARNATLSANNTPGFVGVSFCKRCKKWSASITVNYKHVFLGYFDSKTDAAKARAKSQAGIGFHENHGLSAVGG